MKKQTMKLTFLVTIDADLNAWCEGEGVPPVKLPETVLRRIAQAARREIDGMFEDDHVFSIAKIVETSR
jgi:succinate dehydrogenase flavin-adding protein (antitoxin of CptAB toxin-antitoxin module)